MQNMQEQEKKRFQPPAIRGDQRLYFLGKTGSGKTFLARHLLKLMFLAGWRIVIVDPKHDWMGRVDQRVKFGGPGTSWKLGTVDHPVLVNSFDRRLRVQIFQPVEWDASCDVFAAGVMRAGNTIIYFDELTQLVSANSVPKQFKILWTQGRSINVGAWCGTQRPVSIPDIVKSQAEVWFIFMLTTRRDRETVEGYIPVEETPELVERAVPPYWFWYYEDSLSAPVLVRPLTLRKKAA